MDELIQILDSKFSLLIIGFLLTSILGKLIANWIDKKNWKNKTKIQLYQSNYEEGKEFIDELSIQIGKRYFLLQRLLWAIRDSKEELIVDREKEYFDAVVDWNTKNWYYRNKIRLLLGDKEADLFLEHKDDLRMSIPRSIHYKFVATHKKVIHSKKDNSIEEAQMEIYKLNNAITQFLESLTTKFQSKANNLKLMNFEKSS